MKFDDEGASVQKGDEVDRNQGAARAISVSMNLSAQILTSLMFLESSLSLTRR